MGLPQIRRRAAQHLDLLLEQPITLTQLPQLGITIARRQRPRLGSLPGSAGAGEPLRERHRVNPEIVRDLLDRHSQFAILRDAHNVIAELFRIGLRHDGILPGPPPRASHVRCHLSVQQTLSAKYIFERTADAELARYNPNYHCEIGYRASTELFNTCVQAEIYSLCKAKFEYESGSSWHDSDHDLVFSPTKPRLQGELESILGDFPLPHNSIWKGLPGRAAHYFRFCKDYHCEELIARIRQTVSDQGPGSLRSNLLNAPLLWIAGSVRGYLKTDFLELDDWVLQHVEFERNVSVLWKETGSSQMRV